MERESFDIVIDMLRLYVKDICERNPTWEDAKRIYEGLVDRNPEVILATIMTLGKHFSQVYEVISGGFDDDIYN